MGVPLHVAFDMQPGCPPPPVIAFFETAPSTPNPVGGQPTPQSARGGLAPQQANVYVHLEVRIAMLVQLYGQPPPPPFYPPPRTVNCRPFPLDIRDLPSHVSSSTMATQTEAWVS